jgi:glycine cleavage system T protein (aminomethyltransferase)
MVDFAGWSMPVQYSSIVAEHNATRSGVGIFDISHMGRLRFDGPGAAEFLDHLLTRSVKDQAPGQIRYALVTNEQGGILDDVLVYHLQDAAGDSYWLLVVNAGNREKIVDWILPRLVPAAGVRFTDATADWAMLAVQGPRALELAQPLVDVDLAAMKYYTGAETRIAGHGGIASRTGYTGEDGCELIVGAGAALSVWESLVRGGAVPAGLGCRDTLRLEAAMPLYGHELSEETDPFSAGLDFAVDLEDRAFPGHDALVRAKSDTARPKRVGLELAGSRLPREGFGVFAEQRPIGRTTSGTFSPTLEKPIAMAYVEREFAAPGTQVSIDIRGRQEPATVVKLPFYRRGRKGNAP